MKAPRFWNSTNKKSTALIPVSKLYGSIVQSRLKKPAEYTSKLPVLCIGNVTMGGSGKTPVVDALARLFQKQNKTPAVLMRGYGGKSKGPLWVSSDMKAHLCGDEALLHARIAPTMVSGDRVIGAKEIEQDSDITHIIMDDGLQNPSLHKTKSILVVDGKNPFGNERLFPAGPLRETIDTAIRRVDALIIMGEDTHNLATTYQFLLPVFKATLEPTNASDFSGKGVLAFAGIGNPQKFFDTLKQHDAVLIDTVSFPDHHPYTDADLQALLGKSIRTGAKIVTTRKDWVRLSPALQKKIDVLDVEIVWENKNDIIAFLLSLF